MRALADNPVRRTARSLHRLTWAGIAVTSLVFLVVMVGIAHQSRARSIDAAGASIHNLALVLEKLMARKIEAIDGLLQTALHEGRLMHERPGSQAATEFLRELTHALPYVKTVKVTKANDGTTLLNLVDTGEAGDGIDLETDLAFRNAPQLGLYISRPRRDGPSRTWLTGISRAGAAGSPAAAFVATAHIDIEQLQRLFDEINIGKQGSIALWRSDGMLLTRKPFELSNVGRNLRNAALFPKLACAPEGQFETVSVADGIERIIAYRALPGTSLIVAVTLAKDEVLAAWRRDLMRDTALVVVALLILIAFGFLLTREAQRRADAEDKVKQKSAALEITLENMDQGLIMFDADVRAQVFNRRALELLDLPPALLLSRPRFEDIRRYEFDRGEFGKIDQPFDEWVQTQKFARSFHSYERERPDGRVLEVRTAPIPDGGAVRTYTDITERKRVEKQISHMARHDALTGLPNRVLLRERIEEALARVCQNGDTLAVLCLDLDQFKAVNDTLGHPIGDELLNAVSERIKAYLGEKDTVARVGGDEFAILQVGAEQPYAAKALARCLVEEMPEPFFLQGNKVNIGVSVGIALAPCNGLEADWLLKCADLALYRAKAEGRGTFRFFEAAMDTEAQARRTLEIDMREALANGQFQLYYQPLMNVADNEVTGFEALLRWHHPSRGLVMPAEFIPVAEETGLIVPMGEWIMRQACSEAARFPGETRVAVNVSAMQLRSPNLVQFVVSALATSGLSPRRLEIEITETVLMQSNEAVLQTLHQLRGLGIRIALDDFGTGYSSLSYLSSFPFDKLKIDRSFVKELGRNADCAAIVRGIISLGASLGMVITAEGVETPEQLEFIRAAGCSEAQGYLLSEPKPAQEAVKILQRGRAIAAA
jgi:diguanylate cyclase (GGDEF)-like protein